MSGLGLTFLRRGGQAHPTAGSDYIKFADQAVFDVLMANGVSSDGVGITKDDAARVTSIGLWFRSNAQIKSFNEFAYFVALTSLDASAFAYSSIEEITLPSSVASIGRDAFYQTKNARVINIIWENVTTIGEQAFYDTSAVFDNVNAENLTSIGAQAFTNTSVKRLNLGKIAVIAGQDPNVGWFGKKSDLEEAVISPTMTNLPTRLFYRYSALKKINVENVQTTGGSSLAGSGVEELNFKSIITLNDSCCLDTTKLKKITLGANCTSIVQNNFRGNSVDVVIIEAVTPPTLGGSNGTLANSNIYVPDASVDSYKSASVWSNYAANIKGISEYQG